MSAKIFLSVGKTSTPQQEEFVNAVETRIRSEGFTPCTVGRNNFSADAPLKLVSQLMNECAGTVVIALERTYFPTGIDRRGNPKQENLTDIRLPTPWNQIEATMAYCHNHPLMVIIEHGLRSEGLLEKGYDWYVQWVTPDPAVLNTAEFNGVLADWKQKVLKRVGERGSAVNLPKTTMNLDELTAVQIINSLKPSHVWGLLAAIGVLLAGAFSLGAKLFVGK